MFWKKARKEYGWVTKEDDDVKKYFELSGQFQEDGYKGFVGIIQDIGHRGFLRVP